LKALRISNFDDAVALAARLPAGEANSVDHRIDLVDDALNALRVASGLYSSKICVRAPTR